MMHKDLIRKLVTDCKPEHEESLRKLFVDAMEDLEHYDEAAHKEIECELYKMVYGNHLNEDMAKEWVSNMKNKDGTTGEHWTIEQTSQYMGEYNKYDWYTVMNMIYSDFYSPKYSTNDYVTLADDWLSDKDAKPDKLLNYYRYIV